MKENNEVTLKINEDLEKFKVRLKENGYQEIEHYVLYDCFMVPKNLTLDEMTTREIISKSVIIRKVDDITKNEIRKDISYKIKNIDEKGQILDQKSVRLKIENCQDAENFMEVIGYKKIMNIVEEDVEYKKGEFSLTTKDIKNGDKMIEVETQKDNENLNTIEKLKNKLKEENIPLDYTDFFVKKAEVELNKILGRS